MIKVRSESLTSIPIPGVFALSGGGALTIGHVYRTTGVSGIVAAAQADTGANAAGILGVAYSANSIASLAGSNVVVFDSLPVEGTIAYLSATSAGLATCSAPGIDAINQPVGTVTRVISATRAWVALTLVAVEAPLSGTFSAPCTSWSLSGIAGNSKGGFALNATVISAVTNAQSISLLVNGSTANLTRSGWYGTAGSGPTGASSADSAVASLNLSGGAIGCAASIDVRCTSPSSVPTHTRIFECVVSETINPTTKAMRYGIWFTMYTGVDEIASVGLVTSIANGMAAASPYSFRRI
ncbi:MAG: hypothetical protein QG550_858 [Pseudomonadota bacterium]|nr:hypothetical protein [Pseudomonadota bacterium]